MLLEVLVYAWMTQLCQSACLATCMLDSAEYLLSFAWFPMRVMSPIDESWFNVKHFASMVYFEKEKRLFPLSAVHSFRSPGGGGGPGRLTCPSPN